MSLATRVIAKMWIKPSLGVVQPIRLEGLRVVGDPHELALKYAAQGADELLYLDVTASLYNSPVIHELVSRTTRDVYVPLTVGGGVRTLEDVRRLLRAGADKCAINTAGHADPWFIKDCAQAFGSQAIVVSVEVKRRGDGWEPFTNSGRDSTGRDAIEWCRNAIELGAGELLITSIDRDGSRTGMDTDFLRELSRVATVPVIASGGCNGPGHALRAIEAGADAIAVGAWLHAGGTIGEIKDALANAGREVRR